MSLLYRLVLALNSTSWMIVVYGIKSEWDLLAKNRIITSAILLCIPIVLSILSIILSKWFKYSGDQITTGRSIVLADNEFLPVYLGYFFVALSVPSVYSLAFVYFIVFVFTFLGQAQYFNPIFLLFGYHYYHVETLNGTRVFVISNGRIIRSVEDMDFGNLRRINDTTFISGKE